MKYITTTFDNVLNKFYKLYLINAKELSERLFKNYGLSKLKLQTFNSDIRLAKYIDDINMKKKLEKNISKDDYAVREARKIVNTINSNTHISRMDNIGISFGYELMPIAVSVEGDIEDKNTLIELVDGFKRMFCTTEVPSIDILVKVYDNLNDVEWINSMIMYNSWKFADGSGAERYMDRGFQLGLYYRYKLLFSEMLLPGHHNVFKMINIYTGKKHFGSEEMLYSTLWNNGLFHDDIINLYKISSYKGRFVVNKRGGKIEEFDMNNVKGYFQTHMYRVYEVFAYYIGELRRYENKLGIIEKKPFDINIFLNYMTDSTIQKHLIKICNMSVDGFVVNYVDSHLKEDIKKRIYEGMGYEYVPPAPKPEKPLKIDFDKIEF